MARNDSVEKGAHLLSLIVDELGKTRSLTLPAFAS
jgi:hypothetical protein